MQRALQAPTGAALLIAIVVLCSCGSGGSGWIPGAPAPEAATTVPLSLGEEATLHGAEGVELLVCLDFTSRPLVPVSLSPESATFLEIHLSVTNVGASPFIGVLADAADLQVVPSGTLAPVRAESVPSEIALTGGLDFGEVLTINPGSPALQGKVIFQIDPDDQAASFSLTIPGGTGTARWDF